MKKVLYIATLLLSSIFTGCSLLGDEAPMLSISEDSFSVAQRGETISIDVMCNTDFYFDISEEDKEWITSVDTRATETIKSTLRFKIAANSNFESRTATIRIIATSGLEQSVTIEQEQTNAIVVTESMVEVDYNEQNVEIRVDANVEFEVDPRCDWIEYVETRAMEEHTIVLHIAENTIAEPRAGTILVKGDNLRPSIKIVQAQAPHLINLTLRHYEETLYSPVWSGDDITGSVIWNDGTSAEAWNEGASYYFGASTEPRNTRFEMVGAQSFTIEQLGSIEHISIEIN